MMRQGNRGRSFATARASAATTAPADLMEQDDTIGVRIWSWDAEAWLQNRLSLRAALGVYVVAAAVGWAGIIGLTYGVRSVLDELRVGLDLSTPITDTRPLSD